MSPFSSPHNALSNIELTWLAKLAGMELPKPLMQGFLTVDGDLYYNFFKNQLFGGISYTYDLQRLVGKYQTLKVEVKLQFPYSMSEEEMQQKTKEAVNLSTVNVNWQF
jgi:hypothetical protein